jgi:hypothetical protein
MVDADEVASWLQHEVAKCKATEAPRISVDEPLLEVIGLHGDDLMAIARSLEDRYRTRKRDHPKTHGIMIRAWAEAVAQASVE